MLLKIIAAAILTPIVVVGLLTFIRSLHYPEKTWFHSFLCVVLAPMRMFKLGPFKHGKLSLEKAMKHASRKTKLDDFGDLSFLDSYNAIFSTETHKKLKLTNIGYIMYQIELNQTMYRRLTFIKYLKDVPEVLNVPVRSPVFVLGLPRTGTTFLHRLLSLDPAVRSPLLWELLSPVPKVRPEAGKEVVSADFFKDDCQKRARAKPKIVAHRHSLGDNALTNKNQKDAHFPE
jgi:hypothetical protein